MEGAHATRIARNNRRLILLKKRSATVRNDSCKSWGSGNIGGSSNNNCESRVLAVSGYEISQSKQARSISISSKVLAAKEARLYRKQKLSEKRKHTGIPQVVMERADATRIARNNRRLILLEKRNNKVGGSRIDNRKSRGCGHVRGSNSNNRESCVPAFSGCEVTQSKQAESTSISSKVHDSKEARLSRKQKLSGKRKRTDLVGRKAKPWNFGSPTETCTHCGAIMWYQERSRKAWNPKRPKFSLCCSEGKVELPLLKPAPPALKDLLATKSSLFTFYRNNIRALNAMFAFTSMGGNIDHSINNGRGPFCFRLNGHNYHRIGSLIPPDGKKPRFAQLYFYDTENEVRHRMEALNCNESSMDARSTVVDLLVKMLDETNVLVKSFRMARDRFNESQIQPLCLRLISSRSSDGRHTNLPTSSEVAAVIVGDFNIESAKRDIIVEDKSFGLKRINVLHPSFMSMQYPLLFPYGEDGFRQGIKHNIIDGKLRDKESYVTMREYYAFRLQQRCNEGDTLLCGGRLLQQYIVDAYTCMEEYRLMWIKNNQKRLRSKLYKGLKDAVFNGDTDATSLGRRILLPSTVTGSPRYMVENYQDAMAICRWAGYPDLFITFTCNPKWPEIESFLSLNFHGHKVEDHPEVVTRVFKIKLDEFIKQLTDGKHFGRVLAVVYTVEFEKRGLPHSHILLFLHPDDKHPDATTIDKIISAQIPNYEDDPEGYEAVEQFMMHGPCGDANTGAPCMVDNKCSKHFPKKFYEETTIYEDGFPIYQRKNDGRFVLKNDVKLDNRFVVPYNRDLLVKYQAHINVECCNRSRSIKYLFKYVTKGPDRGTFALQDGTSDTPLIIDEVKMYLQCRYVSASEACWRIYQFEIHYRKSSVKRLAFHLEDEQNITFNDEDDLNDVMERPDIDTTMFTVWMKANRDHPSTRELTYVDFPTKWVWHRKTKEGQESSVSQSDEFTMLILQVASDFI